MTISVFMAVNECKADMPRAWSDGRS